MTNRILGQQQHVEACDEVWSTDPVVTPMQRKVMSPMHEWLQDTHVCDQPAGHAGDTVHVCHCGEETWGPREENR
jgi:hypothetical protein